MAYFRQVWDARMEHGAQPSLILHRTDPDGYMGFPGTVDVTVTYTLTRDDTLRIDYRATADKKTVINLINHSYFSLGGPGAGTIDRQSLQLFADAYTPVDAGSVPSGEIRPVAGTDFDFTMPTVLGPRLASADSQMQHGHGLDHNFVIRAYRASCASRRGCPIPDRGAFWRCGPPAGHAGLFRQWRAAGGRQGERLGAAWRDLVPDPALSGFAASPEFPLDRIGAGRGSFTK